MHLHGFFYSVVSRGRMLQDTRYGEEDYRLVVTETMRRHTTMDMEWVPTRPGNWLFHCHLSFHVSPEIRLPRPEPEHGGHGDHSQPHMAGLVLGIEVEPGPTDLVWEGEPRYVTLYANEYSVDSTTVYGFSFDPGFTPDSVNLRTPGPLLILEQHQPTYVTVTNNMSIPTGVHWHGLELDSWADGVPGWSASDGMTSPVIDPGDSFTYKLASMRPGTFIYHSHLDDIQQLTKGLYGPLLVLPDMDDYDAEQDHIAIVGWRTPNPRRIEDAELNGRTEQPVQHAVVGEEHRIRVINIAPAGMIMARMTKEDKPVDLIAFAKDGADLPPHQMVGLDETPRLGVGETADFLFKPSEAGTYELMVGYGPRAGWRQRWEVSAE
jgi:FtsP/CotA-like multicopper oxidase with cupredoxin domain